MAAASVIPSPPRIDNWPAAVRSAELLRGSLVRCGPGVRLAAWPESPRVRLMALAPWGGGRHIAVLLTAAWVWGACSSPGQPLTLSTVDQRRPREMPNAEVTMHQYPYLAEDLALFGRFRVTERLRTACDLLRYPSTFTRTHQVAVRLLLLGEAEGRARARDHLSSRRQHLWRRALSRLEAL